MKPAKQLGIWMDHSTAHIMKLVANEVANVTLESSPAFTEQVQNLRTDESQMHDKAQNKQSDFYRQLSYIINEHDEVLLFGPTDAKTELFNLLKANSRFEKTKITVQPADKMRDNQQQAYVKNFYHSEENKKEVN